MWFTMNCRTIELNVDSRASIDHQRTEFSITQVALALLKYPWLVNTMPLQTLTSEAAQTVAHTSDSAKLQMS